MSSASPIDVVVAGPTRDARARWCETLLSYCQELILVVGADGGIECETPSAERILGYSSRELGERDLVRDIHPEDRSHVGDIFARAMREPGVAVRGKARFRQKRGGYVYLEGVVVSRLDDPIAPAFVVTARDVSERRLTDALLGLPNGTLLTHHVERALEHTQRSGRPFAVLAIGLDRFRAVNDSLGDAAGDALLFQVADRLRRFLRPLDVLARLGGDTFGILLADIAHAGDALRVAGRMREGLNEPFLLQNQNVVVSASVGLVAVPPSFGEPRAIIRHAETALGRAKQQGAGGEEVFDEVMREEARARIELESALHDAVSKRVFEAHYQPIVAVETGRTMGLEALVRWHRPGLGSVSPEAFLSVAEDLGLAEEIDLLVLERALETLCRLRQTVPDLYVTVNLSGPTLHDSRFVEAVKSRLADSGVPPSALVLEVTESALIEEEREVARRMERLRKLGVRFALDDFGTGYASLSYLRSYPFDVLKIDRSFVGRREPGAGSAGPALLEGIVALGRHLGLTLVAEGIESEEHLETARSTGCPFAQGPWFSPPADEAGAARWLETSPRHP